MRLTEFDPQRAGTDLFRVVEHARDLLGVTLEDGHDLARVLVEDRHRLVVPAGHDA